MFERREGPQLAQQLVGGVRVAVQDKLLQGAAEEELQGARAEEPLARHVVEQKLHQLWGEARQAAAVLHAGSCGGRGTAVRGQSGGGGGMAADSCQQTAFSHRSLAAGLSAWPRHITTADWGS